MLPAKKNHRQVPASSFRNIRWHQGTQLLLPDESQTSSSDPLHAAPFFGTMNIRGAEVMSINREKTAGCHLVVVKLVAFSSFSICRIYPH
jgi:hypothetical protein